MREPRPEAAKVAWEPPTPPRLGAARLRLLLRAGVGLLLAVLLAACGRFWVAGVAAVLTGALLGVGLLWPLRVESALETVTRRVGVALAFVLLTPFYFLVLTPLGFLIRLRRDPLDRRWKAPGTYWIRRSGPTSHRDLF